jgi:sialate O-acetylesterase
MVSEWRSDWNADFPFYAVQLVNFKKPTADPVEDTGWTFVRECILKCSLEVPGVGMAVGIDAGEADDIHPKNKQIIGYRLARQALVKTYGKDGVAGGPIYKAMEKEGSKIIIRFDDVGSGLVGQGGEPLKWFAIAGEDRKFFHAPASIVDDTVVVCSENVPDPVAVRYAWANNPAGCNLFNKEGFPASPFRTDNWPAGKE